MPHRAVYQFPATNARPDRDGQIWPQATTTDSLFKPPATRTALPLVLFPRFTITNVKRAQRQRKRDVPVVEWRAWRGRQLDRNGRGQVFSHRNLWRSWQCWRSFGCLILRR